MPKYNDNDLRNDTLIKSKEMKECIVCGQPTYYIDYICEGRICSNECSEKFYNELIESQK